MPLHHRNLSQVPHLPESQTFVDPPGGLVVVEVHAQQRRHSQPRALLDHPPFELPANTPALVRGGDVLTDFRGGVVRRAAAVERRQVRRGESRKEILSCLQMLLPTENVALNQVAHSGVTSPTD
jgi:hypothetical protein